MTDEELEKKCGQILDKALSSDSEFLHFLIWVMSERVKKIASEHSTKQDFHWDFEKGEYQNEIFILDIMHFNQYIHELFRLQHVYLAMVGRVQSCVVVLYMWLCN